MSNPKLKESKNVTETMWRTALQCVVDSVDGKRNYFEQSNFVKNKFDTLFGGVWCCIVSKIGGICANSDKGYILIDYNDSLFVIFKCRD
uniref:Dynein light chain n=1 Tax=Panagrolaimus sp. JU765 TaxID=591449 RepID=A0AC34Q3J5_9BILA